MSHSFDDGKFGVYGLSVNLPCVDSLGGYAKLTKRTVYVDVLFHRLARVMCDMDDYTAVLRNDKAA